MIKKKVNISELSSKELAQELERLRYRGRFWTIIKQTLYTLLAVVAVAILIAVLWLPVLRIYGQSMNKTLQEDDLVLTVKGSSFETGDVIAFYYNNKVLVKRVIAQSGDWVNVDSEGDVYVNQKKLDEPYVLDKALGKSDITYPYQVPDQEIFVLGDNRSASIDSRNTAIGGISEEQIVGKISFRIWPLDKFGTIK
ncbi:signal peptidase I [Streptococcus hillyeri]|uniref:Signal peptidase I n=1 Tax=Streptococcus hillyeri TaxID=2282420 RepID=A0A3L9DLS6_9STRE|nr:signal peptidase I [Streptococcus hillyeri]RLY01945.1 signal peptidase I [Streptococcus hillyeri]